MVEIDRREYVAQRTGGLAIRQDLRAELVESRLTHGHDRVQGLCGIGAIVPQIGLRMGAVVAACMQIGDVEQTVGAGLGDNVVECTGLRVTLAVFAIEPGNRDLVPFADIGVVGSGCVEVTVGIKCDQRGRIVHHRGPVADAGSEIMGKSERVADLVGRELADTGQGQFQRVCGTT